MPAEDDLRVALRSLERHAPDADALLLRLSRSPGRRRPGLPRWLRRAGWLPGAGWLRVITPLAAAAAVIAVVAASLAITAGGTVASGPRPETTAARAAALASIPPYYVVLTGYAGQPHRYAEIRASATGAKLATVTPPRPYGTFSRVSGAADDRTFIVAVQRWVPIPAGSKAAAARRLDESARAKFFLLRFSPAARTAHLVALPVPGEPGGLAERSSSGLAGIALSPDGSKLAIALQRPAPMPPEIKVASVATGAEKTWVWPGHGWIDDFMATYQPLSWAADGHTLAFQQGHGNYTAGVRLLDTNTPGGSLLSSSKPAAQWQFAEDNAGNIAITPDGSRVIAPVTTFLRHPLRADLQIREFSASTGKLLRVAGHWRYIGAAGGRTSCGQATRAPR